MQCPQCHYRMPDVDTECPRCASKKTSIPTIEEGQSTTLHKVPAHPFPKKGQARLVHNGTLCGPYTLDEINNHLESGDLHHSDQLLTDSQEWIELTKVDGIIAASSLNSLKSASSVISHTEKIERV